MLLASTASKFHQRPSELIGITDHAIALSFDLRCGELLLEREVELETYRLEAMGIGGLTKAFGAQKASGPISGQHIGEITQANLRDQKF